MAADARPTPPSDDDRRRQPPGAAGLPPPPQQQVLPPGTATFGMWLFLIALFMLFAAAMIGYVIVRLQLESPPVQGNRPVIPAGALRFPPLFWFSTAFVLGVSLTLGRSLRAVRRERQASFRRWLSASIVLGAAFLAVQAPAMGMLLLADLRLRHTGRFLFGLIFVLVLLHALHVVGGMIALVRVAVRGARGTYDHEHYLPVRHVAMYWHFLDAVWLTMFGTFLLAA